jgi:putative cell wall-binding protein
MVGVWLAPATVTSASAAEGDVGYAGFQYRDPYGGNNPDISPTASKPQSKLWFAQGQWWAALVNRTTQKFHIYSFDAANNTWSDTGVAADAREGVDQVDVLWDNASGTLYVAGHSRSDDAVPVQLSEFTYSEGRWIPGTITQVNHSSVEAAVMAKDTKGRLWVAYTAAGEVRLKVKGFDHSLSEPFFNPPVEGWEVDADDIASITAHDGKVSVVWSNQVPDGSGDTALYVASHADTAAPREGWDASKRVFDGPRFIDDHISIQSAEGAPGGSVYVVVKTGKDTGDPATDPLIVVVVLRPSGLWESYVHSTVASNLTRPILLLEPSADKLHVLATGPEAGGVIYKKTTSMSSIQFDRAGRGEPFIQLAAHPTINNATSTKQHVRSATGMLVLAADPTTGHYVHNYVPGTTTPPAIPQAGFTYTPSSGTAPLKVSFANTSTNADSWSWDFGDGSAEVRTRDAEHTFTRAGTYTVTLTASKGSAVSTKKATVTVTPAPQPQPFSFDRLAGADRYGTAASIARDAYTTASDVVIASGSNFPDALSGNYLAGLVDGPILLTRHDELPAATSAVLKDLGARTVHILGGTASVGSRVEAELRQAGYEIRRIAGADRYETSADIATSSGSNVLGRTDGRVTAIVASGATFPDALAAGPLSAARSLPILLTRPTTLPDDTERALRSLGIRHVLIAGGPAAVSTSVENALNGMGLTVKRIAGDNRAETAVEIARFATASLGFADTHVNLARGDVFADALAGGPHGGRELAPILLTRTGTQNAPATLRWLEDHAGRLAGGHVFGGTAAVSESVEREAERRASPQ